MKSVQAAKVEKRRYKRTDGSEGYGNGKDEREKHSDGSDMYCE